MVTLSTFLINIAVCVILLYALTAMRRTDKKQSVDRDRLDEIQSQLSEVSRQNSLLQREINTDGLTKIGNRAQFDIVFHVEWDRAMRGNHSLALLMIDIDHFKRVNDRYGHVLGDQCLIAVALAIRGCLLRSSDRVMRYGGEEFAVLLGDTNDAGVALMCERILSAVRALEFPERFKLTVSLGGGSVIPSRGQRCQSFLEAVDAALYVAKKGGRDRFEMTSTLSSGDVKGIREAS